MKKVLLFTTALSISFIQHMNLAQSACVTTPTCAELGYNASSCPNGGLKCPFGNMWNCEIINYKDKITELEKIIKELKTELKQCQTPDCMAGDILYSDMTINADYVSNKTPIGVVFDCRKKLAIGLEESDEYWSTTMFDVPGLSNITSPSAVTADWQGKNNTRVVLEYCKANGKNCQAFEYVNSYKTEGTQAGDWYLPSMGELNAIHDNMDVLNNALGKIAATKLGANDYWSSSEDSYRYGWTLYFYNGGVYRNSKKEHYYVRPVLAF